MLGPRAAMQNHIDECKYGKIIDCPLQSCNVKASPGKVVDHLINIHQALVLEKPTGIVKLNWPAQLQWQTAYFKPTIAVFDGHTFLLNRRKRDFTNFFWVTMAGNENDAQGYEVKMIVAPHEDATTSIKFQGKVYGIGKKMKNVPEDGDGVLEIRNKMVGKMSKMKNGNMGLSLYIDYHIICK